ncbi:MAG: cbb3-type cytochrome oxidase assembly protein CcoS [Gammaproteobacteria bacterium]|jgi:cbb3-type cytochrome oxidase maturation protein|nr:cbb3-type cytochrome oxidase assembly protein CcoS [Gammaproteobacteria bacterium]
MNIIYVLIPLSVLLMLLAIGAFFWAIRNDQFDDLDTPALDILDEDDDPPGESSGDERAQPKQGKHGSTKRRDGGPRNAGPPGDGDA